jgi:hypothetical protein
MLRRYFGMNKSPFRFPSDTHKGQLVEVLGNVESSEIFYNRVDMDKYVGKTYYVTRITDKYVALSESPTMSKGDIKNWIWDVKWLKPADMNADEAFEALLTGRISEDVYKMYTEEDA